MPDFKYFVERLREFALKNMETSGNYQVVAGVIRGKEIFNLSANRFFHQHAETSAIRRISSFWEEAKWCIQGAPT